LLLEGLIEELRKRQEYLLGMGGTPDDIADDGYDPDEPTPAGGFSLD
jgi:hypothetical protein